MIHWNSLLEEMELASVFPATYRRFVQPIRAALIVFLEGLPESAQNDILARQAMLSPGASFSERLTLLASCCPVLHKIGQTLARDRRIAPELRRHLCGLESPASSLPDDTICQLLEVELGPLERRGIRLSPPAIAEASVAVVMPFIDLHHTGGNRKHGVLKVLKPGIEERLEIELELMLRAGRHLDNRCNELRIPRLDYEELFEQICQKLRNEVQLYREQRHLCDAAAVFAGNLHVQVPALVEQHCTGRVTAIERIFGWKATDCSASTNHSRPELAETAVRALISQPIFACSSPSMFHGDPHAGNLFLTHDNRLAILDWSLVGSLSESGRVALVQLFLAAIRFNEQQLATILASLSEVSLKDPANLLRVVQRSLQQIRGGAFPGLTWLVDLLDAAVQEAGLRPAANLLLFRKSLYTLEGVLHDIDENLNIDRILLRDFLEHAVLESPRRLVSMPRSRAFATRLSNFDLLTSAFSLPGAATRFWMEQSLDLMRTCLN